jgi:uncharacterized protein involved in exopolysaccharide biosynthesis/Mrp family chromosome partitioning ATPase
MDSEQQIAAPVLARQLRPSLNDTVAVVRGVGLTDMMNLLRRNWAPILGMALVGAIAAYAYAATLPKTYVAESTIAVAGDRLAIPQLQGALQSGTSPDPMPTVRTEMRALGARQLLAGLVGELHLDRDPEFNGALRPPTLMGGLIEGLKSLFPRGAGTPVLPAGNDSIVNAVDHALVLTQDNRSLVIAVAFTSRDPNLSAAAVNRLIADYVATRTTRSANADLGANTAMTQRIDEVRAEIDRLEHQMQQLRNSSGMVAVRAGSVGQQQVEDLTTEASRAAVERSEIEANLARASAAASTGSADELASVLNSPTISRLREQETEASGRVADMSAQFGSRYPLVLSAKANLASVRAQLKGEAGRIVASLGAQLNVARAHEADLQRQLTEARKAGAAAQETQAQLEQMQQDIATRRNLYGTLLVSAQQAMASPHSDTLPDVRVLSVATPPNLPSGPNMKLAFGLGGLSGALLAGLIAFVRTGSSGRFVDSSQLMALTGATIIAQLRHVGRHGGRLTDQSATGHDAEALSNALARVRSVGGTYPPRVLAMVGAQTGRQTAATAAALSRIAARRGRTVLLIGLGAGNRDFSKLLGIPANSPHWGAANDRHWRDMVLRDAASPLDLLFGDVSAIDPAKWLVALENLLVEARDDYDLIVLGAPAATDAEALWFARSGDVTILVVDMEAADPTATQPAAAELAAVSRNRLAAILVRSV